MSTEYYSCRPINEFNLHFNNNIHNKNNNNVRACCRITPEDYKCPGIALGETGRETIDNFIKNRNTIINELINFKTSKYISVNGCLNCNFFTLDDWIPYDTIKFLNIATYPSFCQCKCIYCDAKMICNMPFTDESIKSHEIMFDAIEYGKKLGVINNNTSYFLASGEISMHPYKKRILNLVGNNKAYFLSNCFIYDELIANNLQNNENSTINLSIDSGIAKTWYTVKGVDNFEQVIENLFKYKNICLNSNQITLKYILMPGINDSIEDYIGLIKLMKKLDINYINIATNRITNQPPHYEMPSRSNLGKFITALSRLRSLLIKNNFDCNIPLLPRECNLVKVFTNNLIHERYENSNDI